MPGMVRNDDEKRAGATAPNAALAEIPLALPVVDVAARHAARTQEARAHAQRERSRRALSRLLGNLRLVIFAAAVAVTIQAERGRFGAGRLGTLSAWLAFAVLVVYHGRIQSQQETSRRRRLLAEESAARLHGGAGPGAGALPPPLPRTALEAGHAVHLPEPATHALSAWALEDLGVEGAAPSLFAMLDTTQTSLGSRRLGFLLRHPILDVDAIRDRQRAVFELVRDADACDALRLAFFHGREAPLERIAAFLALPRLLPGRLFRLTVAVCGILAPAALAVSLRRPEFLPLALLTLAIGVGCQFATRRATALLRDAYLELEPLVRAAMDVAPLLRARTPESDRLRSIRQHVLHDHAVPLPAIRLWIRMLRLHETGLLYGIVNVLTAWDLQWLLALESALERRRGRLETLVAALADLEAHLAIATWAAERRAVVFPRIHTGRAAEVDIRGGEHPLLPPGRVVANDVVLGGEERLVLVGGSNMAGKSTFLRMAALNTILAQIGSPVRAGAMSLVPLRLHANINVRDSLADGKSYFLVEVERVRDVLEAAAHDATVFGVFDELFRGTNSTERLAASREIARTLAASGGIFLLATHDQELMRLVCDEGVPGIGALHFRDEIEGGRMVFPYRAHAGVSRAHNALRLLELCGYPESIVGRARRFARAAFPEDEAAGDSGG